MANRTECPGRQVTACIESACLSAARAEFPNLTVGAIFEELWHSYVVNALEAPDDPEAETGR